MTTQRRGRRSQARPRVRTSRRVWVNEHVDLNLVVDTIQITDLLSAADQFMLFDATVLAVIAPTLTYTMSVAAVEERRSLRWALVVGKNTLDSDDVQTLFTDSIGAPWLYFGGFENRFAAVAAQFSVDFVAQNRAPIRVKAKRRFVENDDTLWLVIQNNSNAGDTNLNITGMFRTLLYVP